MGQQGYPYPPQGGGPYGGAPQPGPYGGQPAYGPQGYEYGQQGYPQPYGAPPPKRNRKVLFGVLGGVVFAVVTLPLVIYFGFFHYTKVASQHVPAGTTLAIKIDLVEVATYGPVKRNLLPLLDENPSGTAGAAVKRSEKIGDAAGFSPSRDIRELVVCFVGDPDHYALIVGGRFPEGKLVPALAKVAAGENSTEWAQAGDILKSKNGSYVVGQASDGTAIFASDETTLRAALPTSSEHTRLGLPEEGAVTYAGSADVWQKISTSSYASMLGTLQDLKGVGAFNGTMTLGNNPKMVTQVSVSGNPEDSKATLYRVFTDLRRISELRRRLTSSAVDFAGEEQALGGSVIETKGTNVLKVSTPLTYEGVDRGAQNLAQTIRTARQALGKPVQPPGMMLPGGLQLPITIPGLQ
jgi:hypothetical protein